MSEETYTKPGPSAQRLGKRIVGEANVARATADKKSGRNRFGKRVLGELEADLAAGSDQDTKPNGHLNLKELEAQLTAQPDLLDSLIEAELSTEVDQEPPRKGAIRLFLTLEKAKPEPRADVVARLEPLA